MVNILHEGIGVHQTSAVQQECHPFGENLDFSISKWTKLINNMHVFVMDRVGQGDL